MALKAEDGGRPEEIGIVLGAMDVVATEARHAVAVHQAGNEIVPLHSVSTPGAVGKIPGIGSSRVTIVEFPEFAQVHAGPKARISHELRFELAADCADYADGALACSGRLNGLCVRHPRNPRNPRLLKSFDKNPYRNAACSFFW